MAIRVGVTIDRSSPVPLYHQLAEQLCTAIRSGQLQPGDPFENEIALAERLNLSRPTVRRAIHTSLYDDLERDAGRPTTTVLHHQLVRDERVAAALDLPADAELLSIVRLRFSDSRPLALLRNWLPLSCADITREQLEAQGLYALLRDRGVRPVVAHQSIGARTPTAAERRHLGLRPSEPVLTMTRSAFDSVGNAVEYGDHCYRAQDYSIEVTVDQR
jgi:DNA-binding GntR family transcriptional regulator